MKVIQACVSRNENHREDDEDNVDTVIFSRGSLVATKLVPVVSTAHLVVRRLIGITRQARTLGATRTYPKSEGSSMTCSIRVTLRGSRGASTIPLTFTSPEHRTTLLYVLQRSHKPPSHL